MDCRSGPGPRMGSTDSPELPVSARRFCGIRLPVCDPGRRRAIGGASMLAVVAAGVTPWMVYNIIYFNTVSLSRHRLPVSAGRCGRATGNTAAGPRRGEAHASGRNDMGPHRSRWAVARTPRRRPLGRRTDAAVRPQVAGRAKDVGRARSRSKDARSRARGRPGIRAAGDPRTSGAIPYAISGAG